MNGKVIVITGATSGIGQVAAEKLAGSGARIVFVARDRVRAESTLARLRTQNDTDHRVHYADLSRLSEMKRVAEEIAATEPRIDVLINNAGAMFGRLQLTPYHVHVPSFGDWGFLLATRYPVRAEDLVPLVNTRFLNAPTIASLLTFPPDIREVPTESHEMTRPTLVRYYQDGWKRWNY